MIACAHFRQTNEYYTKNTVLSVLHSFALHQRHNKRAQWQSRQWSLFRHFRSLKYHTMKRRGEKLRRGVVEQFRAKLWQVKVLRILKENA
jgi:hypothetical protein